MGFQISEWHFLNDWWGEYVEQQQHKESGKRKERDFSKVRARKKKRRLKLAHS
jgi:hypothetical protein